MVLERLGQGGQGEVFKVLDTDTVPVEQAAVRLGRACFEVRQGTLDDAARASWASEVKGALATMRAADDPRFMGALKTLVPVAGGGNMEKAVSRFVAELRTYSQTDHPNVLRLRDANEGERWCVTEFIPGGALACKQTEYVGAPLKALTAFRGLVAGVAALHDKGCIHRDIKPENVFVAADGRLVLGDAGIAFYFDADTPRLTETLENVGSRDWMAPWFMGRRTDVNASADLFSLGKLLWWMCSGLPKLLLWYHREESETTSRPSFRTTRPSFESTDCSTPS
ncbi:MAG: protein kinase [Holophagales bacterium]|nr:protein kinase [Holophagales bacterium]